MKNLKCPTYILYEKEWRKVKVSGHVDEVLQALQSKEL